MLSEKKMKKVNRNSKRQLPETVILKTHPKYMSNCVKSKKSKLEETSVSGKTVSSRRTKHTESTPKSNETEESKHVCRKSGCGKSGLTCCIKGSNSCMEASGKSARWYHLSSEEHYCNGCFEQFYRARSSYCDEFHEWKRSWMQNSKADGSFKNITTYLAERQLPYWVQCTLCGHWRSLANAVELTPNIVKNYTCIMGNLANTTQEDDKDSRIPQLKYSCSEPNDSSVETALDPIISWMSMLSYTPFLKNSPAAPFLTGYFPDGVGMSAVDTNEGCQLLDFISQTSDEDDVIRPTEIMEKISVKQKNGVMHTSENPSKHTECSSMMTSPGGRKQTVKDTSVPIKGLHPYFQPFYKPYERGKALCMRPDVMELDEAEEFPPYYKDQTVYLGVRNLIIALWTLDPCRFLTVEKCCEYVLLRGLTRVRLCTVDIPRILHFTIRKGLVNFGALGRKTNPSSMIGSGHAKSVKGFLPDVYCKQKVIVVGVGPAGLAAARQLHNFGCDVVCLEARDRIGGRVHDDWSLGGVCVGRGAQIINGCVNNPLALISHQLGIKMHVLQPRCDLFDGASDTSRRRSSTEPVPPQCDKRMDFHFNSLLDIIVDWRQAQDEDAEDCSLGEKIQEAHQEWIKQSGLSFTKLEERLLNFHIGNLEFACGASLDLVSAFHWDQNEIFAQFSGDHTFVQYGFGTILSALADGLDIQFNKPVTNITYTDSGVEVKVKGGKKFKADRVLISVPLAVLRSGSIRFHPPLPEPKTAAINRLGCGCIEKIGLQFSHRFWDEKIDGANYFGYVPSTSDKKGFFSVFYDVPYPQCEKSNVLMSVISGEAVDRTRKLTDKQVMRKALSILRDVFPEQEIPEPIDYFLTRWKDDPYSQMAYSFVKRGSSGDDYDELAKEVDDKVFFAGEGTNRHFPQTVTGAYLSGVREASKIASYNKIKRLAAQTASQ